MFRQMRLEVWFPGRSNVGLPRDQVPVGSDAWSQSKGTVQFSLPDDYAKAKAKVLRLHGLRDATGEGDH